MKKLTLSCDDGCASDIKVAGLASKYKLSCVFYLPLEWHSLAYEKGYMPIARTEVDLIIRNRMCEIGSHTITHRHLTRITSEQAEYEIAVSRYGLQDLLSVVVYKFAPPRGYTNDELTNYTLTHYDSQRLTRGLDAQGYQLVHVHPNSGANNNRRWQEVADEHDKVHLWMHSWELDKFNLWDELEEYIRENTGR